MSQALAVPTPGFPIQLPRLALGRRHFSSDVRIATLLLLVLALNLVDLAYTMFAHRIDMLDETNPLAHGILAYGLTTPLIIFKIAMVGGGCTVLWKLRHCRFAGPGCWLLVTVYAALGIVWYLWVRDVMFSIEAQMNLGPIREIAQAAVEYHQQHPTP